MYAVFGGTTSVEATSLRQFLDKQFSSLDYSLSHLQL